MSESEQTELLQKLRSNPTDLSLAWKYWNALGESRDGDPRSGCQVIEIFGEAAFSSCNGAVALAKAYHELFDLSGEEPQSLYFTSDLMDTLRRCLTHLTGEDRAEVEWVLGFLT